MEVFAVINLSLGLTKLVINMDEVLRRDFLKEESIRKGLFDDSSINSSENLADNDLLAAEDFGELMNETDEEFELDLVSLEEDEYTPEIIESDEEPPQSEEPNPFSISVQSCESLFNQPEFSIQQAQILETYLSTEGHLCFSIEIFPMDWCVTRSMRDFLWLKDTLTKTFPGVYVPPVPKKKLRNSHCESKRPKQVFLLQSFLDCILRNPFLRNSFYVHAFFKEKEDYFAKTKLQLKSSRGLCGLEEFLTDSVNTDLVCDEDKEKQQTTYISNTQLLKRRLKKQSSLLVNQIQALTETLGKMKNTLESLENLQNCPSEFPTNSKLYSGLKKALDSWSAQNLKSSQIFENYWKNFFNYGDLEIDPMKQLIKNRDVLKNKFKKTQRKLENKKQKLWQRSCSFESRSMSFSKNFEEMLPQETQAIQEIAKDYGYWNFHVKKEISRVLSDNIFIENHHFQEFAKELIDHNTSSCIIWSDLLCSLQS